MNEAMKKEYIQPESTFDTLMQVCSLCIGSDGVTAEGGGVDGVGGGGVDEGGIKDPDAKMRDEDIIQSVNDNSAWDNGLW